MARHASLVRLERLIMEKASEQQGEEVLKSDCKPTPYDDRSPSRPQYRLSCLLFMVRDKGTSLY